MGRECARGLVDAVSAEVSIVSVNPGSIIRGRLSLEHIFLPGSIAFHELGGKVCGTKAKYPKRIPTEKGIGLDLPGVVHVFSGFKLPDAENGGGKMGCWRRKRIFFHLIFELSEVDPHICIRQMGNREGKNKSRKQRPLSDNRLV
jgi:hypothetical protein